MIAAPVLHYRQHRWILAPLTTDIFIYHPRADAVDIAYSVTLDEARVKIPSRDDQFVTHGVPTLFTALDMMAGALEMAGVSTEELL